MHNQLLLRFNTAKVTSTIYPPKDKEISARQTQFLVCISIDKTDPISLKHSHVCHHKYPSSILLPKMLLIQNYDVYSREKCYNMISLNDKQLSKIEEALLSACHYIHNEIDSICDDDYLQESIAVFESINNAIELLQTIKSSNK